MVKIPIFGPPGMPLYRSCSTEILLGGDNIYPQNTYNVIFNLAFSLNFGTFTYWHMCTACVLMLSK